MLKLKSLTVVLIVVLLILSMGLVACAPAEVADEPAEAADEPAEAAEEPAEAAEETAEESAEKITIGISMDLMDSPYWEVLTQTIADTIGDKGETIILVAQSDVKAQNDQIASFISQGVDAIICVPRDGKALSESIKKCNEAGIPFIFADRPIESTENAKVDYGVATNNFELAKLGTQWMVDYAKKNDIHLNVLVFVGGLTDNNAIERDRGFMEILEANPDVVTIVQKVPTEWQPEKALAGTVNALQANEEINCIFTPSDYLLPAITSGLQQADRYVPLGEEGHIMIATFDGDAVGMEAIRDGYALVDMCQPVFQAGQLAAEAAMKLIAGEEMDKEFHLDPGFLVTIDNFEETAYLSYGWFGTDN